MKKNKTGQNAIEYLLIFAVVIGVFLVTMGPSGIVTQKVNSSFWKSSDAIYEMADEICFAEDAGPWTKGPWGPCGGAPGACVGTQSRTLTCPSGCCNVNKPTDIQNCNMPAVDGGWTSWSGWTGCSTGCINTGTRTRSRSCTSPAPACGGADCTGVSTQSQACGAPAVDGGWSAWSPWSACTATCGGTHTRTRACNNPPASCGGADCVGSDSQTTSCNSGCCPVQGEWCPWGAFSNWSPCSSCTMTRSATRTCDCPGPSCGGNTCSGASMTVQVQGCGFQHGGWGGWSGWSGWSSCVSCSQRRSRDRLCNNPAPACGGNYCSGTSTQFQNQACGAVNGGWTNWSSWSVVSCSHSGGNGSSAGTQTLRRTRTCTNPPPQCSGANCSGQASQTTTGGRCCRAGMCLTALSGDEGSPTVYRCYSSCGGSPGY